MGKICTKCSRWKPLTEFHRNRTKRDGCACWCKICVAKHGRLYRSRHREKEDKYNRRHYEEHKEEIKARVKAYREAHPEWAAEKGKRDWQCRRARKAGAEGSHTCAQFEALCEEHGWVCLRCGTPHGEVPLTEDHVVPLSKGGSDDISNVQPLCVFCNDMKGTRTADHRGGRRA